MKKTFQLRVPGKDDRRVLEIVKSDVGRYVNREKRKPFPAGFDLWTFTCKVGPDAESAVAQDLKEVPAAIDAVAAAEAEAVYVEIIAAPGSRPKKIDPAAEVAAEPDSVESVDSPEGAKVPPSEASS